jgi:hypothetical protein
MNPAASQECYSRGGPQQEQSEAGQAVREDRESRSQRECSQAYRLDSSLTGRIPKGWNCFVPLSWYLQTAFRSVVRAE